MVDATVFYCLHWFGGFSRLHKNLLDGWDMRTGKEPNKFWVRPRKKEDPKMSYHNMSMFFLQGIIHKIRSNKSGIFR